MKYNFFHKTIYKVKGNILNFLVNKLKVSQFFLFEKKNTRYLYFGYNFSLIKIIKENIKINNLKIKNKKIYNIVEKFKNFKNKCEIFGFVNYESSNFFYNNYSIINFLKSRKRIIFDKKRKKITIYFCCLKKTFISLIKEIKFIVKNFKKKCNYDKKYIYIKKKIYFSKKKYFKNFKKIIKEIKIGNIMQIQVSKKIKIKFKKKISTNLSNVMFNNLSYNNCNYLYYFNLKKIKIIGNSPETLIKKKGELFELKPIAGTISRGKNIILDKFLEKKILNDKKEICEHNMLIDLCRNDINAIYKNNNIFIKIKKLEKYSYVQHIVSTIVSKSYKKKKYFINIIKNIIPSGTLSGSPKFKAMKIIRKVEKKERKLYGGAIGFFLNKKNYNFAILIRTIIIKSNNLYTQAASGIVSKAKKRFELKELYNKTKSIFKIFKYDKYIR